MVAFLRRLLSLSRDDPGKYFYPPYCIFCGEMGRGPVCDRCVLAFSAVSPPICPQCGKPLRTGYARERCPDCSHQRWYVDAARSLYVYRGTGRQSLHRFKYHRRRILGRYFAEQLLRHFGGLSTLAAHFGWDPADAPACMVPLPLHPLKRFRRGFNQNELVVQFYAPPLGLPVASGLLHRVKNTRSQVGLGANERFQNVRDAFAVPSRMLPQVENRSVLLFDDLITTGATINAAARALKSAGATRVFALSLFTASLRG